MGANFILLKLSNAGVLLTGRTIRPALVTNELRYLAFRSIRLRAALAAVYS